MHSRCWLHSLVRQSRYKVKKKKGSENTTKMAEQRGRERQRVGEEGVRGDVREELRGCTQSQKFSKKK